MTACWQVTTLSRSESYLMKLDLEPQQRAMRPKRPQIVRDGPEE